jgi:hypothetical protein
MTAIAADYFHSVSLPSRSFSAGENIEVENAAKLDDIAASPLHARAANDLFRILGECSVAGWDGYRARPITAETCIRTFEFLFDLPQWMTAPDLVPEADGQIAIEWSFPPSQTLSISIGAEGPLHFAGTFRGGEEIHGVAPYSYCIPESVLQILAKTIRTGTAAIRRAA